MALPLLLATLWAAHRGSTVGLLLWPGTLFYVLYTYTQYLLGAPFGPLFLVYILLVVLSAYATIALLANIDGDCMRRRLAGAVPARTAGGILVALALLTIGQDAGGALATALEHVHDEARRRAGQQQTSFPNFWRRVRARPTTG